MTEKTCPDCNRTNIAGGCCISNDDPAFSCNDCGNLFGNREKEDD